MNKCGGYKGVHYSFKRNTFNLLIFLTKKYRQLSLKEGKIIYNHDISKNLKEKESIF